MLACVVPAVNERLADKVTTGESWQVSAAATTTTTIHKKAPEINPMHTHQNNPRLPLPTPYAAVQPHLSTVPEVSPKNCTHTHESHALTHSQYKRQR